MPSMKKYPLLLILAATFAYGAPTDSKPLVPVEEPATASTSRSRVDLDFKGGPPAALVDAISKSLGKQVNVIIGDDDAQVRLPAIHVQNATVADIFVALANATTREITVPTGRDSYQTRSVRSQFLPTNASTVTDETVWSFVSNEPETQQALQKSTKGAKPALRHFQLGTYLVENLRVEDITTAIRTGWEMLGIKEQPELKFHKETGILIAAGDAELLDQIPMVLQQLLPQEPARPGSFVPQPLPRFTQPPPSPLPPTTSPSPAK